MVRKKIPCRSNPIRWSSSTPPTGSCLHARRLEEGGYVSCTESFQGRMPRTEYRLTEAGRKALARYLDHMEALIDRVRDP